MTEEIVVYFVDMETYLEPKEYQAFLKAKQEVDEYNKQEAEYEKKKADAESLRDEYRKKMSEAENTLERDAWYSKLITVKTFFTAPYFPIYYFQKHDHYLDLVRERKLKHLAEEELKERRLEALEEIDPPFDEAKKYLSDREYERFSQSLPGAADAYLDSEEGRQVIPNVWLLDKRAGDYLLLTGIVKERKEKKARRKRAQFEHSQFLKEMNDVIKKFKQELAKVKKPSFAYPPALAKYHPEGWCELEQPTKEEVKKRAEQYIWQKVPQALKNFVSWELSWQVKILPYAEYEVLGVPCLTWCFRTFILVEVHLKLVETKFTREFHGYEYSMRVEGENLGRFYLGPVEWDHQEGFSTPIALLSLLAQGEIEGPGIEVTNRESQSITFAVQGFQEDIVEVRDTFRKFIKDIVKEKPLAQALLAKGLIDQVTAQLVEEKAKLPLPQLVGAEVSAGQSTVDNSDVKAALEGMGFKMAEIKAGMEAAHLSPGMGLEEKVGAVLKILGA